MLSRGLRRRCANGPRFLSQVGLQRARTDGSSAAHLRDCRRRHATARVNPPKHQIMQKTSNHADCESSKTSNDADCLSCAAGNLIARYEEGGSYPKPRSWANCDEFGPPYQFFPRYGRPNSSQLTQLLGFGYDPPSSYLAIKLNHPKQ